MSDLQKQIEERIKQLKKYNSDCEKEKNKSLKTRKKSKSSINNYYTGLRHGTLREIKYLESLNVSDYVKKSVFHKSVVEKANIDTAYNKGFRDGLKSPLANINKSDYVKKDRDLISEFSKRVAPYEKKIDDFAYFDEKFKGVSVIGKIKKLLG